MALVFGPQQSDGRIVAVRYPRFIENEMRIRRMLEEDSILVPFRSVHHRATLALCAGQKKPIDASGQADIGNALIRCRYLEALHPLDLL